MAKNANRKLKTPYANLLPGLSSDEFDALRADIEANGMLTPIVIDEDDNILDGHHRYRIDPAAPVTVIRGLTEGEKRAFVYRANFARRNMSPEQKHERLKTMRETAVTLRDEGRTQEEIGRLLGVTKQCVNNWFVRGNNKSTCGRGCTPAPAKTCATPFKLTGAAKSEIVERVKSGETQEAVANEFKVSQQTVSKVVAKHDSQEAKVREAAERAKKRKERATIALADAPAWLAKLADGTADLLLTDPPYSTDVEDIDAFAQWAPLALRKVKPTGRAYVCVGPYPNELRAYLAVWPWTQVLVWTYRNTLGPSPTHSYKANWQAVLYWHGPDAPPLCCPQMKEQFSVFDISAPDGRRGTRWHQWEKPGELAQRIIVHSTQPGDLVIDPFAGTGTFLLAAAELGRIARGCDCDKGQIEICRKRGCRQA